MSEDERPKVVSMASRRPVASAPAPLPPMDMNPKYEGVDTNSIQTLNNIVETLLNKKCSGVCAIASSTTGLPKFWISFPEGKTAQIEAVRYLGMLKMFEQELIYIVEHGVANTGDTP